MDAMHACITGRPRCVLCMHGWMRALLGAHAPCVRARGPANPVVSILARARAHACDGSLSPSAMHGSQCELAKWPEPSIIRELMLLGRNGGRDPIASPVDS